MVNFLFLDTTCEFECVKIAEMMNILGNSINPFSASGLKSPI